MPEMRDQQVSGDKAEHNATYTVHLPRVMYQAWQTSAEISRGSSKDSFRPSWIARNI
jgi:hypothetical protein